MIKENPRANSARASTRDTAPYGEAPKFLFFRLQQQFYGCVAGLGGTGQIGVVALITDNNALCWIAGDQWRFNASVTQSLLMCKGWQAKC